ncbi:GNAT family N-acetyltransferase [Natronobacterium gregoryi]|uniref:Acetyltransferase, N-acetylglutamate synthase n=2 Tax=Natronobacterium gregoryi TaxID=44930 RepID=L0AIL3_NATGS|nr:GNAT family N-acetyltransferase [Natronobacterium gregoryi]AFZ72910.1 acetyltransferase, N-acetylglutamate synthase [Natronobacterium gregoryi SP2]ELY69793.1 GCN5-related N-acetyltransferase [Natronobacterium gregoryi SP2]PLK21861.1 N-acetyltransferase [Natronobacterium gregoryi SP2]SFI66993.1 Acetyltransferase (GNAT) domain-containing protein [Natronobacterium gregoryi]
MEIRPATTDDRERIRKVARRTWHDTYDELEDETIDATIEEWYGDDALETAMTKPGTTFLVAEKDGEVVGFTHGVVTEEEGDILRLSVHPDYQGEGLGTALYERLREDLQDFNMGRMRAIDLASNEEAKQFYEHHGFERTDEDTVEIGGKERTEAVYTVEL